MSYHSLKQTITKLKERGVISKAHAEAMLQLVEQLNTPEGKVVRKTMRLMVVKALADILSSSLNDR